jgi:RNA-directed DNA polymerase
MVACSPTRSGPKFNGTTRYRTFSQVDHHAWRRTGTWIRRKHGRISWREVRHRFCDTGWRFAHNGVAFRGASTVAVTRYRYRGSKIATPWTTNPATTG